MIVVRKCIYYDGDRCFLRLALLFSLVSKEAVLSLGVKMVHSEFGMVCTIMIISFTLVHCACNILAVVGDVCKQVLQLPANSVWSVWCMSNGDIACGSR